jgi:hypothetical protein
LVTGRILQFDERQGHGEDTEFVPLLPAMTGDRGCSALTARLIEPGSTPVDMSAPTTAAPTSAEEDGLCDVLAEAKSEHKITALLRGSLADPIRGQVIRTRQSTVDVERHAPAGG